jgi:hypothetical protein
MLKKKLNQKIPLTKVEILVTLISIIIQMMRKIIKN